MKDNEIKYMIEGMGRDIALMVAEDYKIKPLEALDVLFNSVTYEKVCDPSTGLYFQSPKYVYSFLKHELETGIIG